MIHDEALIDQVEYLLERVRGYSEGVDISFHPVGGVPSKELDVVIAEESVGAVVVPMPPPNSTGRMTAVRLLRRTAHWNLPVLFTRGSQPYRHVVAPARETPTGIAAARAAIDIAGSGKGSVVGVAVVPPVFVAGTDGREAAVRALALMREEASVLDVPMHRVLEQGNPIRVIASSLEGVDLLVLGRAARRATIFTPGIVGHLLERVPISVLVVPGPQ